MEIGTTNEIQYQGNICRCCRKSSEETAIMFYLYNQIDPNIENLKGISTISELLHKYVPIDTRSADNISPYVCIECYEIVVNFHKFYKMCVNSYAKLTKQQATTSTDYIIVKQEQPIEDPVSHMSDTDDSVSDFFVFHNVEKVDNFDPLDSGMLLEEDGDADAEEDMVQHSCTVHCHE